MKRESKELQQLVAGLNEARGKLDAGDYAGAKELLAPLRKDAARLGVRSAALEMAEAAAATELQEHEAAFRAACAATVLDPLHPAHHNGFGELAGNLRGALVESSLGEPDEATARMYELLAGVGEADAAAHVALARYQLRTGAHAAAGKLLDAVTLLQPYFADAWALRSEVALAVGDGALAESCATRAREVAEDVPFAVPGTAARC